MDVRFDVRKVDPACRPDFWRVHCDATETGWCCCVAWHVPTWDGWGERTAAQNRELRESLFDRGEYDGYLLYANGSAVAWCQVGPRDRLTKLREQYDLAPDPSAWAITCFVVAPAWRGQGIADRLLGAVLGDLASNGVRRIEAFPRAGDDLPSDDAWTGPERLYRKHGFAPKGGGDWPVWVRELSAGSPATQ